MTQQANKNTMYQMLHKSNTNSVSGKGQVTIFGQECLYKICKHHSHFQPSLKWHQYVYYNTFWMQRNIMYQQEKLENNQWLFSTESSGSST